MKYLCILFISLVSISLNGQTSTIDESFNENEANIVLRGIGPLSSDFVSIYHDHNEMIQYKKYKRRQRRANFLALGIIGASGIVMASNQGNEINDLVATAGAVVIGGGTALIIILIAELTSGTKKKRHMRRMIEMQHRFYGNSIDTEFSSFVKIDKTFELKFVYSLPIKKESRFNLSRKINSL